METLERVPAIILTAGTAGRLVIQRFIEPLAHVANIQIARLPIKAPAPGIAQAQRPDFRQIFWIAHIGVVRRDFIGFGGHLVYGQGQHLTSDALRLLRTLARERRDAAAAYARLKDRLWTASH